MSMDSCEKHGWWGQDACPSCEITLLRAEVDRLQKENAELVGRPSPYSKQWSDLAAHEGTRIIRERISEWFRGSHYVNVLVRRNAVDEEHEADWLKYVPGFAERLARERDEALARIKTLEATLNDIPCSGPLGCEALAQVAVLTQAAEAHLNTTALDGSIQTGTWIALQTVLGKLPAKARAFLDRLAMLEDGAMTNQRLVWLEGRLQRAEAVVEAALQVREDARKVFAAGEIEGTRWTSEINLHQALAAWEKGKV